jgi:hypothetical protein
MPSIALCMMAWMMTAIGNLPPLPPSGLTDSSRTIFRPVIGKVMEKFQPSAILLQCGADSLSGAAFPLSLLLPPPHFPIFSIPPCDKSR